MTTLLSTLTSYVSPLAARRYVIDTTPLTEPHGEWLQAAVLFADISGFTALAEKLAEHGVVGAEELTQTLNDYIGQLINIIAAHGGEVVKFAGDAVLATWAVQPDSNLTDAVLRAAQCALDFQGRLKDYHAPGVQRLLMRVGISGGEVALAHLGGVYGRWEFLIVGEPLGQATRAEQLASPGEVLIAPTAWEWITAECVSEVLSDGTARLRGLRSTLPLAAAAPLELPPESETAIRAYIPGAILARLAAGQSGWIAELRQATVIFINLPDINHATPLVTSQAIMQTLQTTLYRYEGSINKLNVDDKGATLVAALGLPPLAHEDDSVRGVQFAMEARAALIALGVRCAIGVTTGRAFCGSVGNNMRREYTLIGDVVNLAARLMQAASDGILCDAATRQAARHRIQFKSLRAIVLKGKAAPVEIFSPTAKLESQATDRAAAIRQPASTMVGREAERALLANRLAAFQRGEGSIVIIEGEAGIGKSRLVAGFVSQAESSGATTLIGAGDAIEKTTSYHAWRPVFTHLFQWENLPDESSARRAAVLSQIETLSLSDSRPAVELAPLLNVVLPLDLPDNDLTAQMSGQARADSTHILLLRLLQRAAPLIVVVEDAHWLDSASWALLGRLANNVLPALIVIATRPLSEPLPVEYRQMLTMPVTRHAQLMPLPPADTAALICQRLGVAALPDAVSALIRDKAEGHPFFSEELAFALRDAGLIEIRNNECHLAAGVDLKTASFPDTVQGVITSRIDRLTPQEQLTLKTASVVGRVFALRMLREIHPIESDKMQLDDYLRTLAKLDLTPLDTPEPELAYIFKHVLTQDVAYNLLLFAQRQKLHRAVAQWIEREYADDLSLHYPILSYHWSKAEDRSKTIEYLEKAGEQSLRNGAYREAVGFFGELLRLIESESKTRRDAFREAHWERQLGVAHYGLGQLTESTMHLRQTLALLKTPMPASDVGLITGILAEVLRQVAHLAFASRFVGRLSKNKESRDRALEATRALEQLGLNYYFSNALIPGLYTSLCTLNWAEAAGPSPELTRAYGMNCTAMGVLTLHPLARVYDRRAWETLRETNDLSALAWITLSTGAYRYGVCDQSAQALFDQGAEAANRVGELRRRDENHVMHARAYYMQGKPRKSAELCVKLIASARARRDPQVGIWALCEQVMSGLWLDESTESLLSLLQEAESLLRLEKMDKPDEILIFGLLARVQLRRGETARAREAAERAVGVIAKVLPTAVHPFEGYAGAAESFLALDLKSQARQSCRALHAYARVFFFARPRAWLWQGVYEWQRGRASQANQAWKKSLILAQQFAMRQEEGLAHYEIGRHATGEEWQCHLEKAQEIFEETGAKWNATQVATATLKSSSEMI